MVPPRERPTHLRVGEPRAGMHVMVPRDPRDRHAADPHPELRDGAVDDGGVLVDETGAPIDIDVELETLSNGLVATGSITTPWVGDCRRCLATVEGRSVAQVREVFEPRPVEGETYPMADDTVDLEPMVRDAVLLALPLAPLCASDCRGPAPESFPTGVEDDDAGSRDGDGPGPLSDPRWAALAELDFEPDESGE